MILVKVELPYSTTTLSIIEILIHPVVTGPPIIIQELAIETRTADGLTLEETDYSTYQEAYAVLKSKVNELLK